MRDKSAVAKRREMQNVKVRAQAQQRVSKFAFQISVFIFAPTFICVSALGSLVTSYFIMPNVFFFFGQHTKQPTSPTACHVYLARPNPLVSVSLQL